MAEVAARAIAANPAQGAAQDAADLLAAPYLAEPLREHDCAVVADGATAVVLAAGQRAYELCERPAWIAGIAHRVDSSSLGARDLTTAPSARAAAAAANAQANAQANAHADAASGATADGDGPDIVELHSAYSHQELILRRELVLDNGARVNPSGGVLRGHAMFAAGLARIGEAARDILAGEARRTLGHATNGPLLQQNLVCVLEAR